MYYGNYYSLDLMVLFVPFHCPSFFSTSLKRVSGTSDKEHSRAARVQRGDVERRKQPQTGWKGPRTRGSHSYRIPSRVAILHTQSDEHPIATCRSGTPSAPPMGIHGRCVALLALAWRSPADLHAPLSPWNGRRANPSLNVPIARCTNWISGAGGHKALASSMGYAVLRVGEC